MISFVVVPLLLTATLALRAVDRRKVLREVGPFLACVAYAKCFCDEEPISITIDNAKFKQQARYLFKRRQLER